MLNVILFVILKIFVVRNFYRVCFSSRRKKRANRMILKFSVISKNISTYTSETWQGTHERDLNLIYTDLYI